MGKMLEILSMIFFCCFGKSIKYRFLWNINKYEYKYKKNVIRNDCYRFMRILISYIVY